MNQKVYKKYHNNKLTVLSLGDRFRQPELRNKLGETEQVNPYRDAHKFYLVKVKHGFLNMA